MKNEEKFDIARKQMDGALRQIFRELFETDEVYVEYDGTSDFRRGELSGRIQAFETAARVICDWTGLSYVKTYRAVANAMSKEDK